MTVVVLGKDAQQPNERLDWDVDYSRWLPDGDSVQDAEAVVWRRSGEAQPPLRVVRVQFTQDVVKVWIAGGAHGSKWRVQVRSVTKGGRVKEAEFDLAIKEI